MKRRNFKNVLKVKNSKRDFKAVEKDLKLTEDLFINNTTKLIYKSFNK